MKREDNPRKFKMKPLQGKMGIRHQVSQRCFNLIFVINDDKKNSAFSIWKLIWRLNLFFTLQSTKEQNDIKRGSTQVYHTRWFNYQVALVLWRKKKTPYKKPLIMMKDNYTLKDHNILFKTKRTTSIWSCFLKIPNLSTICGCFHFSYIWVAKRSSKML